MLSAGLTKVAHLQLAFFLLFFWLGDRGVAHPPSDDEGTERTWQLTLQLQQPVLALELRSVFVTLPLAWRTGVSSAPAATCFQEL